MRSLLGRRRGPAPVVEGLEDRRLLSHAGPPSGWDYSPHGIATQAQVSSPQAWPVGPRGDNPLDNGSGQGSSGTSRPTPEHWVDGGPSFDDQPVGNHPPSSPSNPVFNGPGEIGPTFPGHDSLPPLMAANAAPSAALSGGGQPVSAESLAPRSSPSAPTPNLSPSVASTAEDHGSAAQPASPSAVASPGNPPPRAGAPTPVVRSPGEITPTARLDVAPPIEPEGPAHPTGIGPNSPVFVPLSAAPETTPGLPQRGGPSPLSIASGPSSPDVPGEVAPEILTSRGITIASPSPGLPRNVGQGTEESASEPGSSTIERPEAAIDPDVPEPQIADMITSLLPFDRSALVNAVDQILGPIDDLVSSMPELRAPLRMVTASLAVAVTVLAVDLAIRLRRSKDEEVEVEATDRLVEFPGLPGLGRGSRS